MATIGSLQEMCLARIVDIVKVPLNDSQDPGEYLENLLCRLSEKRKLNDCTLSLFQPDHGHLKNIKIPNAEFVTKEGLKILRSHQLSSLHICDSSLTIFDVLNCLGPENWKSLIDLRCTNLMWADLSLSHGPNSLFPMLSHVRCLRLVNLGLTDRCLNVIGNNFPCLHILDISENLAITNISPLQKHAQQLRGLVIYRLSNLREVTTTDTLRKLKRLKHLDMSLKDEWATPGTFRTSSFLMEPSTNPRLVTLDLSGRIAVSEEILRAFLDAHRSLCFLGLAKNRASEYPMFDPKSSQYRRNIRVAGSSNPDQRAVSQRRYLKARPDFCQDTHQQLWSCA